MNFVSAAKHIRSNDGVIMDQNNQDRILTVLYTTGIIGFIVGIVRGVIEENHGGFLGFVRGVLSALVVSVLVGLGLADSTFPPMMQTCIVGVCAYIS
jgi:hypothetical protein